MRLWYMRSEVLNGFYRSEVYAVGRRKEEAIHNATQAYDRYIKQQLEEFGALFLINASDPDDPDFKKEAQELREKFIKELHTKFKQTKYQSQIDVAS
jgi:hypothetical protein